MTLWQLAIVLLIPNIVSFTLMGLDKSYARKRKRRISERTLMISAACFGSLGAMAAMLLFRHKTLHAKFAVGFPLLLGVHLVAVVYLIRWLI